MKLSEAFTLFEASRRGVIADRTLQMYRQTINRLIKHAGNLDIEAVTVHHLRLFRGHIIETGISTASVVKYVREVRTFFTWLEQEELITKSPAKRLEKPRQDEVEPRTSTEQDIAKAIAWLESQQRWGTEPAASIARTRCMLYFLADTGCRLGGLLSLTSDNLDLEALEAVVLEKGRGGRKRRVVYFTMHTKEAIEEWLFFRPETDDPHLIVSLHGKTRGQALKPHSVTHLMAKLRDKAGITGHFHPHSFRHGAARRWLKNGMDIASVSQLLGHSDIEVTFMHYSRWSRSALKETHAKFSKMVPHEVTPTCEYCGKPLTLNGVRRFCSRACGQASWKEKMINELIESDLAG